MGTINKNVDFDTISVINETHNTHHATIAGSIPDFCRYSSLFYTPSINKASSMAKTKISHETVKTKKMFD